MNEKKPGKFFASETGLVVPLARRRINYDRWQLFGASKRFTIYTTSSDPNVSGIVPIVRVGWGADIFS